jgi:hypothetical protein
VLKDREKCVYGTTTAPSYTTASSRIGASKIGTSTRAPRNSESYRKQEVLSGDSCVPVDILDTVFLDDNGVPMNMSLHPP